MKRLIVGLALTLLWAPPLRAEAPVVEKPTKPDCAAMMQQHEQMQKHMEEMDAKLQGLVAEMNKAEGPARIGPMAAVLTELVAQRVMMRKQMADMQPKMMEHMMAHMQGGMAKGGHHAMAPCPMMKGTPPAPPAAEHKH